MRKADAEGHAHEAQNLHSTCAGALAVQKGQLEVCPFQVDRNYVLNLVCQVYNLHLALHQARLLVDRATSVDDPPLASSCNFKTPFIASTDAFHVGTGCSGTVRYGAYSPFGGLQVFVWSGVGTRVFGMVA